jgi:hypothetical protein
VGAESNFHLGVVGDKFWMMIVRLCQLADLNKKMHRRFEAVKLPLIQDARFVGI